MALPHHFNKKKTGFLQKVSTPTKMFLLNSSGPASGRKYSGISSFKLSTKAGEKLMESTLYKRMIVCSEMDF